NWTRAISVVAALLISCHCRILDRSEESSVELTQHNINNEHVDFDCRSRNFQIYEVRHRPRSCDVPKGAKLVGDCSKRREDTVKIKISLTTDEIRYFLGRDAHDFVECHSYLVTVSSEEEDYEDSNEKEIDRLDWRRRELVNLEREERVKVGSIFPSRLLFPSPIIHSRLNELPETKIRPLPSDVVLIPVNEIDTDLYMKRSRPISMGDVFIDGEILPDSSSSSFSLFFLLLITALWIGRL
ncbi:hypothetical protein PFISCL1PPCAC_14602, partial [Pristionchus fissidentatus]